MIYENPNEHRFVFPERKLLQFIYVDNNKKLKQINIHLELFLSVIRLSPCPNN